MIENPCKLQLCLYTSNSSTSRARKLVETFGSEYISDVVLFHKTNITIDQSYFPSYINIHTFTIENIDSYVTLEDIIQNLPNAHNLLAYIDLEESVLFESISSNDITKLFETLKQIAMFVQLFTKRLKKQQLSGNVIFLGNHHGMLRGTPGCFVYDMINNFYKSLVVSIYEDMIQYKIRAIALYTSFLNAGQPVSMQPIFELDKDKMISFQDIKRTITFLLKCSPTLCVRDIILQTFEQPYIHVSKANSTLRLQKSSIDCNYLAKPVALITGASKGIGKEVSVYFSKIGFDLILIARDQEHLREVESICNKNGSRTSIHSCDLGCFEQIQSTVSKIIQEMKKVNVVFCNAGTNKRRSLLAGDIDTFSMVMNANFTGHSQLLQLILPMMATLPNNEPKSVIFNGTIAVNRIHLGNAGISSYCASKFAMLGMSNSLFEELRSFQVKVSYLFIGLVNTDLGNKKGPFEIISGDEMIQVDDICSVIDWILTLETCSPTHLHIVPGQTTHVSKQIYQQSLLSKSEHIF